MAAVRVPTPQPALVFQRPALSPPREQFSSLPSPWRWGSSAMRRGCLRKAPGKPSYLFFQTPWVRRRA